MSYSLEGKIAIVTGASEGIGKEIAKLLAEEKATVVLAARSKEKLESLSKELSGSVYIPTDLRNPADRKNLIDKTVRKFKRIDILVNNAGQGMLAKFEDINLDEYKNIMELNVFAVVDLMQRVIPVMRKNGGGRILNISSMLSKVYMPGLSAYSSTKYALNALSFTARQELAKDNIIVSVMHPKMTLTNFGKNAAGKKDFDPNEFKNNDRFGGYDTPKDVAEKTIELIKSGEPEYCM